MNRRKLLCFLLAVLTAFLALPFAAAGASAFEKSLSGFPESYRVILREVHRQHPNWVFKPMQTGLSFFDAVKVESSNNRSLVPASNNYSYIFKSHEANDYNAASDYYYQKDGGFCNANKYAVSWFMDPRNHFNDAGIFQFEDLSFDEAFDVQAVDVVLAGTFMYNTKPTYYTSSGETKTSDETYAEMIYTAGKKYNINPCYLASKIRNEIGSTPSGSVTGRNSTYPGIYNFYNIGASDGAGAITRGLAWASKTDGTYHRPWTTPKKSIVGGAEFLAATYIGKGQYTGYLQRFNVNPDCSYPTYEHQYMTSLSGAAEQSYSAYYTYLSNGLLDNTFIFSIPVFEGMTGADDNTGTLTIADAKSQTGIVSVTSNINVRTGPSQNYDKLDLTLAPGTKVTILGTSFTDTGYYDSILRYPNWYKIRFKQDGKKYTGYVPCGFIKVKTTVSVARGEYTPKTSGSSGLSFRYVSLNPDKVTVVNDTKLRFLASGEAGVLAYDSTGRFAILRYKISATGATQPTTQTPPDTTAAQPTTKPTTTTRPPATTQPAKPATPSGFCQIGGTRTSVTLQWNPVANAAGYTVYQYDKTKGLFTYVKTADKPGCTVDGIPAGGSAQFKVKAFVKASGGNVWGESPDPLTAYTTPDAPAGLRQSASASDSVTLSWKAVAGASGYEAYLWNAAAKTYQKAASTAQTTCVLGGLSPNGSCRVQVRAVRALSGSALYGAFTDDLTARTGPAQVKGLRQSAVTATGFRLTWDATENAAGYKVFRIDPQTSACKLVCKTKKPVCTVSGRTPGQIDVYAVKAFRKEGGTYYGTMSEEYLTATRPDAVKGLTQTGGTSSSVSLSWNEMSNVSGYGVFRYVGAGWKKVKTVSDPRAVVESLPSGSMVKFRVRAYIRVNKQVLWGGWSPVCSAVTNN